VVILAATQVIIVEIRVAIIMAILEIRVVIIMVAAIIIIGRELKELQVLRAQQEPQVLR
jgi:hypothetical protein